MRLLAYQSLRRSRAIIALVLMGIVLLVNAMAASPKLHEWFHSDAGKAGHQCAVTMFSHGQVDSTSADVPVPVPLTFVETAPFIEISVFSPSIENLPAGRAPPASSSNS